MIKCCIDSVAYQAKPRNEFGLITNRIVSAVCKKKILEIADLVGNRGHSLLPSILANGGRRNENFLETQMFVLDFDDGISYKQVKERAIKYHLPISFSYKTFSATVEHEKFRVIFLHEFPIKERTVASTLINMFLAIFPEADRNCKDVARLFLGGKGVIDVYEDNYFTIEQLNFALFAYLNDKDAHNYSRNIMAFANKNNLVLINDTLGIVNARYVDEIEEITAPSLIKYRVEDANSSNSYIFYFIHQKNFRVKVDKQQDAPKTKMTDLKVVSSACQLYDDFLHGDRGIDHEDRFLIMCNLRFFRGGEKLFLEQIETNGNDIENWKTSLKYIRNRNYKPMKCINCKYRDKCSNRGTMYATLKSADRLVITLNEDNMLTSVERASESLKANLDAAIDTSYKGIIAIKAQTAIGKTYSYCQCITERIDKEKFIIALPTNKLKEEVSDRLKLKGVEVYKTPSIDDYYIPEEIRKQSKEEYQRGIFENTRPMIKDFLKTAVYKDQIEKLEKYLTFREDMIQENCIVTTHAMLLSFDEMFLDGYTVIIDEDILSEYIFKQTKEIDISELEAAAEAPYGTEALRCVCRQIIQAPTDTYLPLKPCEQIFIPLDEEELAELSIYNDINSLPFAGAFCKKNDGRVLYFVPRKLPRAKYIVLSATLDEEIYKYYFSDQQYIKFIRGIDASYTGKLIQYTYYSLGRGKLDQVFNDISQFAFSILNKKSPIITFKKYQGLEHVHYLYFGNLSGSDVLNGQDIVILGTPFSIDENYKLIACYLGGNCNLEGDKNGPREMRIEYKGYSFLHVTYLDQILANVQRYMISSELEQAVGRARILRKDCTVILFSSFPCEQAEIHMENYLN